MCRSCPHISRISRTSKSLSRKAAGSLGFRETPLRLRKLRSLVPGLWSLVSEKACHERVEWPAGRSPKGEAWHSHRDSNPDSSLRRAVCYPLHYGSTRMGKRREERFASGLAGSRLFGVYGPRSIVKGRKSKVEGILTWVICPIFGTWSVPESK